jgi:hypothetical protein
MRCVRGNAHDVRVAGAHGRRDVFLEGNEASSRAVQIFGTASRVHSKARTGGMHGAQTPRDSAKPDTQEGDGDGVVVIDKIDFLVRFWELKARNLTLGEPLSSTEQVELLSLMQLVTGDDRLPAAGPVLRTRSALPAQIIGTGTIKAVEVRAVTASALLVAGATALAAGSQAIVRVTDAVSGVEYALPCKVVWAYVGTPCTMALAVDGIPTRTDFTTPPSMHTRGALTMGRPVRFQG